MNAKDIWYRRLQRTSVVAGFIMLVGLTYTSPRAFAQDRAAHQMRFKTCEPVEFPGRVLDPGTYYIRRNMPPLRSGTDTMIEVLDQSRQHVLVSTMARPAKRLENPNRESLIFYETAAGTPRPVRTWYLPGDVVGYDFIYPAGHLEAIAGGAPSTAEVTYCPLPTAEAAAPPEAPKYEAPPEQPPVAQPEEAPTPEPTNLPKTAGELPLLLVLGSLSLLGGGLIRFVRHH